MLRMSGVRYGDYNMCWNCGMPCSRGSSYCSVSCREKKEESQRLEYEKRENRQKWLESLHARVKRFLEKLDNKPTIS